MKQIYSEEKQECTCVPNEKTIQFLINFSKTYTVVKTEANVLVELNLN